MVNVRPVAKISGRGFGFHKDKLALIALCVIQRVAHGIRGGIGGAVDDCIAAISLTLHAVGVVAPGGLVFTGHHIPLIDLILGIGCDLAAGFAVGFLEVDLQTPLIIFHNIVVVGVCGYRDGLAAAVRAPVLAESIRYCDFLIAELDASQLRFGRCYSIVDSALGLTLQFRNCRITGAVGGRISSLLRGERTNLSIASARCFGNGIVQAPACSRIAAVLLVVVIGGMTAGGYGLFACRADRPAAAVNAAGFGNGFDLDGRAVHLFLRFQLDLIRADSIGKIKTAAGSLGRCLPAGVVFLHNRFRLRFFLTDLRTNQGNGLPTCTTGIIDVGVVTAGRGVGFHAIQQLVGRGKINFRGSAFGEVFDDIHLHIVINRRAEIQKRDFFTLIRGKNGGQIVCIAQRKLVQAAPDANLVAVVVTGDALVCVDRGSVHIGVCRASCRLTVGTVGAAVGGFAVEPNQPSAVDLGNLGDLATCHRRGGAFGKGGNFAVRKRILGSGVAGDGDL